MSLAEKMQAIRKLEDEIMKMTDELKLQLVNAIMNQRPCGKVIRDGNDGGPAIMTVRLSELRASTNWTPAYYIPAEQAKAVAKALDRCRSARSVCLTVRDIIQRKKVSMSTNRGDEIYLNEQTIELLQSSEIGQFCMRDT